MGRYGPLTSCPSGVHLKLMGGTLGLAKACSCATSPGPTVWRRVLAPPLPDDELALK